MVLGQKTAFSFRVCTKKCKIIRNRVFTMFPFSTQASRLYGSRFSSILLHASSETLPCRTLA